MPSVIFETFGGPDVLQVVDTRPPRLGPGEVLVQVAASGVNYFDTLLRRNAFVGEPALPCGLGVEIAGAVVAAGKGAEPWLGRRVAAPLFAIGRSGGYASEIAVPADACVELPDGFDPAEAVALMVQGLTALHAVRAAEVAGRTVMVLAAAGGVGGLLLQLARQAGATRVIAAVGQASKLDAVRQLGADAAVTYDDLPDFHDAAEVVLDLAGGTLTATGLAALQPGGLMLCGGMGRARLPAEAFEAVMGQNQTVRGFSLLPHLSGSPGEDLRHLFRLSSGGLLSTVVDLRPGLESAQAAHADLEARRTVGKIVLLP